MILITYVTIYLIAEQIELDSLYIGDNSSFDITNIGTFDVLKYVLVAPDSHMS